MGYRVEDGILKGYAKGRCGGELLLEWPGYSPISHSDDMSNSRDRSCWESSIRKFGAE
jgi:hypothetical protein